MISLQFFSRWEINEHLTKLPWDRPGGVGASLKMKNMVAIFLKAYANDGVLIFIKSIVMQLLVFSFLSNVAFFVVVQLVFPHFYVPNLAFF